MGVVAPAAANTNRPIAMPSVGSMSCSAASRGALFNGLRLPESSRGFHTPREWYQRGHRYGSDTLVNLLVRAAATVTRQFPGSVLGVGDLSRAGGGSLGGHRSHQSGRDVDLHFYALDPKGRPMSPDNHMAIFSQNGRATRARAPVVSERIQSATSTCEEIGPSCGRCSATRERR